MSNSINPGRGLPESKGGQKIYVWIVTTSALLLIGLLLWPLSVKQFRTTTVFHLRYAPTSGLEKASLNNLVVESMRGQTERAELADIVSQMKETMSSSILRTLDPDTIRQSMHIQGRPGDSANAVEYQLTMVGDGTKDEIEFINSVASRINSVLSRTLTQQNTTKVVADLTKDFIGFHDNRLDQLSGQLHEVMQNLDTIQSDIRIASSDLQTVSEESSMVATENLARPTAAELDRLMAEKRRLLSQPGVTEYHPQVMVVRREIERVSSRLGTSAAPTSIPVSTASVKSSFPETGNESSQRITNQFVSTPNQNFTPEPEIELNLDLEPELGVPDFSAPVGDIVSHLELIDFAKPKQTLNAMRESLSDRSSNQVFLTRLNDRATEGLAYSAPVTFEKFELARRSSPIGGAPTTIQFTWLFILAGLVGSAVALNFDPSLKKRRFRNVDQMQKKLSLPVIGVLRSRRNLESPTPFSKLVATRAVQICEWTLLALAVLLILTSLVNSEVAAAFIENPFHGITKTFWLMTPHAS